MQTLGLTALISTPDHIRAHKHRFRHWAEIESNTVCGCFYCPKLSPPSEIVEWIDEGQIALWPYCPVDSVIGSASGLPITKEFLKRTHDHWF